MTMLEMYLAFCVWHKNLNAPKLKFHEHLMPLLENDKIWNIELWLQKYGTIGSIPKYLCKFYLRNFWNSMHETVKRNIAYLLLCLWEFWIENFHNSIERGCQLIILCRPVGERAVCSPLEPFYWYFFAIFKNIDCTNSAVCEVLQSYKLYIYKFILLFHNPY